MPAYHGQVKPFFKQLPRAFFAHRAVVHGVNIHNTHAVQVIKAFVQAVVQCLLVQQRALPGDALHQQDILHRRQAILLPVSGDDLAPRADEYQLGASAAILHTGVGGQRGGQRNDTRLPDQRLWQHIQRGQYAARQVIPRGQRLGGAQDALRIKIIQHGIRVCAAGIQTYADVHVRTIL